MRDMNAIRLRQIESYLLKVSLVKISRESKERAWMLE